MRLTLVVLIVLCVLFVGCGSPKAPSSEQIEAALNDAVKKDSPNASAKLTDIELDKERAMVFTKFTCLNCLHNYSSGEKKVVPSAEGYASMGIVPQDKKWKFLTITIDNEDGGKSTIHSDHLF